MASISNDNTDKLIDAMESASDKALEEVGLQCVRYAQDYLDIQHAVDTGRLRGSIEHIVKDNTAYVGTNVFYAPYVEMGTIYMRPRSYLKAAAANHAKQYVQMIAQVLEEELSNL